MSLVDITVQLEEPFPLEDIELLPKGSMERDGKTFCMALPYADPRVYQDRLNKLAPGEWQTPAPLALVVGTKLVCYVTIVIYGVPHTDVGEAGPGENQGTEAFAQAFKRAASQFGLGRYLYNLEKAWVPYNPKKKQIDLDANGIKAIAKQMYQKAGVSFSQNGSKPAQAPQEETFDAKRLLESLYTHARTLKIITDLVGWQQLKCDVFKKMIPDEEITTKEQCDKIKAELVKRKEAKKVPAEIAS